MEETIAELRRQLEEERQGRAEAQRREEEERQAREEAERREEEEKKAREEAERREEEEKKAREEAELRVQPNTLFRLLDRCHTSLSQAIRVETDATLTTQGDATDLVNRLYPKLWRKLDRTGAFTSRPLFPSDTQIDYVVTNIQNRPIYSQASLRNFERDTVDNFVEKVIKALRDDEPLRYEFRI
ncbi:unnamed protein product [Penicillium egyptiacum]|uniref:Uncharacterized protein n=1 Tax=Penicillium egyptiacum TaxID=1303716 RepID=A0A9W4KNQ7_9EURO|nr:unnamed protein product [Penicillium egyptiacum]